MPTNARQRQSSISRNCRLEQKCWGDLPILSERNSLDITTATDDVNFVMAKKVQLEKSNVSLAKTLSLEQINMI